MGAGVEVEPDRRNAGESRAREHRLARPDATDAAQHRPRACIDRRLGVRHVTSVDPEEARRQAAAQVRDSSWDSFRTPPPGGGTARLPTVAA